MRVAELMSKRPVTVEMDDTLGTVKRLFDNARFHHLLVVEEERLMGVVSDRDLLRAISPRVGTISETAQDAATLNKRVHQVLSRQPITLGPDALVYDAVDLFVHHRISCIPVVDEGQRPVGIVSWRDILRALKTVRDRRRQGGPE